MARSLKKEFFNTPNAITLARIGAIPVFLYFTWGESRLASFIAALVYTVTSLTDFLDGYIARRKNLITVIGKFLDPLADKLVTMSALVMLVHLGRVGAWVVIVLLAREFIITGLRTIAMSEGIVIPAGQEGKYKTAIQLVGIIFLILHYRYQIDLLLFSFSMDANQVGTLLLYISLIFSVWSAVKYFVEFIQAVYRKDDEAAAGARQGVAGPEERGPQGARGEELPGSVSRASR